MNITLEFLWKFISQILSDSVKDRIKPKSSTDRAKERVYDLYRKLGNISRKTTEFVNELKYYTVLVERSLEAKGEDKKIQEEKIELKKNDLSNLTVIDNLSSQEIAYKTYDLLTVASQLMHALPELANSLDRVNPQLDIHKHALVQQIEGYMYYRKYLITELDKSIDKLPIKNIKKLRMLVVQAEENRDRIQKSIEEFRNFLVQEFPFRNSF